MAKSRNWLECTSCDSMFAVRHTMDENYYKVEYCPFCGDELDLDEGIEFDEDFDE